MKYEHVTRRHRRRRTDPTTDPRHLERRRERRRRGPDASGGWRSERPHQHVPEAVRTDGGRPEAADDATTTLPAVGAIVEDRERDDAGPAVVVATHPNAAAVDWPIDALDGATVADVNPEYAADDPIVTVAFIDDLYDEPPHGAPTLRNARKRGEDALRLVLKESKGAQTYEYPAGRLEVVEAPPRRGEAQRAGGEGEDAQ